MAKGHMVLDATIPAPKQACVMNWAMCMFCQQDTREALKCPARSTKAPGSDYTSLAQHLLQFQAHGNMPMDMDIE